MFSFNTWIISSEKVLKDDFDFKKIEHHFYLEMVGVPGLEPGTPSLSGTYSNQLSYTPRDLKMFFFIKKTKDNQIILDS